MVCSRLDRFSASFHGDYLFGRAVIENLLALADRIAAHSEGFGDLGLPRPS